MWTLHWPSYPVAYIMSHFDVGMQMHLYILFAKFWIALFGNSEVALKMPSLVAGIVTLPVLYVIGRRWVDLKAAIIAVLLAGFSPTLIYYSRYARVYAILILVVIVTMNLFLRALERRDVLTFVLLGVVNALGVMLSLHFSYLFMVQGCAVLLETVLARERDWKRLLCFAGSFSLAGLLASAFYCRAFSSLLAQTRAGTGAVEWRPELLPSTFERLHPLLTSVVTLLLGLGTWAAIRRHGAAGRLLCLWAIVPLLALVFMRTKFSAGNAPRYVVFVLPAHFLLIGLGSIGCARNWYPPDGNCWRFQDVRCS
jgi:uncharacterized membrane protein